jgi:fumarate hydratase subunit alpha
MEFSHWCRKPKKTKKSINFRGDEINTLPAKERKPVNLWLNQGKTIEDQRFERQAQMREIDASEITRVVEELCISVNQHLNEDVVQALKNGLDREESPIGKDVLQKLLINADIAREKRMALCQDTGLVVIFCDVGQEVHVNGSVTEAINEGVRCGYRKGYLRNSVVRDPINRVNTGDNTPAVIHYDIVPGDSIRITAAPKGFGSENSSALTMLTPADGIEGVKKFVLATVEKAGPNSCPPLVVGVGLGGTMEKAAWLAKKSLCRTVGEANPRSEIAALETELLTSINKLGIGPAGLGGRVTALAVNVEVFATHIAGLPVAVNLSCHALRHAEAVI